MIVVPTDRKIMLYGPEMINVECEYIDQEDAASLPALREYMVSLLREWTAIGLSAPQVGVFKNYFIFEMQGGSIIDMVNPEITGMRGREVVGVEACLSVPPRHNDCPVARQEHVTVEYGTSLEPHLRRKLDLSYRDAVVAQHEADHLTGTFFFDRVDQGKRRKVLDLFHQWKVEHNVNEKINSRSFATACS
jgi:peptide deformylase